MTIGPPSPREGPPAPAVHGARISNLRIRHLQLLDAIGRQQSLTVAAASVGTSQPRATNMLREMEDAFGSRLLDRSPRGVRLNAAGAIALERLRIALGALDAVQHALRGGQDRPILRIGVLPLVGSDRLSRVAAQMQADPASPRIVLRVGTVGALLDLLAAGEVDCAICGLDAGRSTPPSRTPLRTIRLWEERNLFVASRGNPITRKRRVSLQESLRHPWLLMPARSANRQALERIYLRAGLLPPEAAVEAETPQMAVTYIACSSLLAMVPQTAVTQAPDRLGLVRLDCKPEAAWIHLITLRDVSPLPAVEVLAQRLIDAAAPTRGAPASEPR